MEINVPWLGLRVEFDCWYGWVEVWVMKVRFGGWSVLPLRSGCCGLGLSWCNSHFWIDIEVMIFFPWGVLVSWVIPTQFAAYETDMNCIYWCQLTTSTNVKLSLGNLPSCGRRSRYSSVLCSRRMVCLPICYKRCVGWYTWTFTGTNDVGLLTWTLAGSPRWAWKMVASFLLWGKV